MYRVFPFTYSKTYFVEKNQAKFAALSRDNELMMISYLWVHVYVHIRPGRGVIPHCNSARQMERSSHLQVLVQRPTHVRDGREQTDQLAFRVGVWLFRNKALYRVIMSEWAKLCNNKAFVYKWCSLYPLPSLALSSFMLMLPSLLSPTMTTSPPDSTQGIRRQELTCRNWPLINCTLWWLLLHVAKEKLN